MKRILNTLYVMTQGCYIHKVGETIEVIYKRETLLKIPAINLDQIVCFGNIRFSPFLLGSCSEKGISVSFMSLYGRFLFRVQGPVSGNVLLRKEQYRRSDNREQSAEIAKNILVGKISNSRTVLERALRDHGDSINSEAIQESSSRLSDGLERVMKESDLNILRGYEGDAARNYFASFDHLILNQKADFYFKDRSRRPPLDRVNCLLSFLYTVLYNDMRSALETVGLDPAVGYLHRDRPGRLSLALDLIEEFRPFIADRLVLNLINLKQIDPKDFEVSDSGAVLMNEKAKKTLLAAYQKRKQEEMEHPFLQEKMHIGLLFITQAQLFARFLRGELESYPPFIWR